MEDAKLASMTNKVHYQAKTLFAGMNFCTLVAKLSEEPRLFLLGLEAEARKDELLNHLDSEIREYTWVAVELGVPSKILAAAIFVRAMKSVLPCSPTHEILELVAKWIGPKDARERLEWERRIHTVLSRLGEKKRCKPLPPS